MARSDEEAQGGPVPPYGAAIHDAIAENDVQQMRAVAEAARKALYGVDFAPVPADRRVEVKVALDALESAIARLDQADGTGGAGGTDG
uniref:DUF1843 domain-containing protein n=1 Tax=Streptomyces sp. NBC_00049 TaxID=2903617 RepID=A0AAU2JVX8_9ACTN